MRVVIVGAEGTVGRAAVSALAHHQIIKVGRSSGDIRADLIDAKVLSDGRLRVRWSGWNSLVDYGTVSLLDKNRNVIKTATITSPPLQATFSLTNKSAFYQVVIHYLNGTVTSVVSPV